MTPPASSDQPLPTMPSVTWWLATSATSGTVPAGAGGSSRRIESGHEPEAMPAGGDGGPSAGAAAAGATITAKNAATYRRDMADAREHTAGQPPRRPDHGDHGR